jgi:hypothetical protein
MFTRFCWFRVPAERRVGEIWGAFEFGVWEYRNGMELKLHWLSWEFGEELN